MIAAKVRTIRVSVVVGEDSAGAAIMQTA